MLIAKGHGYAGDNTFAEYEVIAFPLATRESRVFPGPNGTRGVTYASHEIRLGRHKQSVGRHDRYAIMMHHGGGTELVALPLIYDNDATIAALLALPEAALYGALYTIWDAVRQTAESVRREIALEWSQAFVDGRIRRSRPKGGSRRVWIEARAPTAIVDPSLPLN